jgi:long-chain acyl-CoA synthetase
MRFHYHDDDAKTADAWRDDAFTVGDVGHVDADGYLFLTDRAVDLVIRGGVNVYPREVEEILYTHPAVVDCAVFGVPDDRLGEVLMAVVETRTDTRAEELLEFCRARLADFKVPAFVELVDELPRQPNGKVLKRVLREQHWSDRPVRI